MLSMGYQSLKEPVYVLYIEGTELIEGELRGRSGLRVGQEGHSEEDLVDSVHWGLLVGSLGQRGYVTGAVLYRREAIRGGFGALGDQLVARRLDFVLNAEVGR